MSFMFSGNMRDESRVSFEPYRISDKLTVCPFALERARFFRITLYH